MTSVDLGQTVPTFSWHFLCTTHLHPVREEHFNKGERENRGKREREREREIVVVSYLDTGILAFRNRR